MTKPVYYKSFRSRNFKNIHSLSTDIVDTTIQSNDIILDIGFGTGESTLALNKKFPDHIVCGIEAYKPGIKKMIVEKIPVEHGDAVEIIEKFDDNKISQIYMLFPDPWQKAKHRKRRLFCEYTFKIINRILKRGGLFQFTSDNINYAFQAKSIIEKVSSREIAFSKHRGHRPITKYEIRGIKKRNFIFDLIYLKN
tara:strand:- start:1364 stop:1948 length:585 start_codon:yes stop_codon:yes gene_type:complete